MTLIDSLRERMPAKYRELAKFAVVGGISYVVDIGLFTLLSHTVLENKVITAKAISILVATVVSYVMNREWSFSNRGGRERHHEAMLFFAVNGTALLVNLIPLAISQYVLGFNTVNHTRLFVSVADFVSANIVGTLVGMAFRFWAYRRWVFPDEMVEVDQEIHEVVEGRKGLRHDPENPDRPSAV